MIVDVTNWSKSEIVEFLYLAEKRGVTFDEDFKLYIYEKDITALYLCKSLQGGYYRKYKSKEELANSMN